MTDTNPATGHRNDGAAVPTHSTRPGRRLAFLTVGALGVVYGDIGTSPLYAMRECFGARSGIAPTRANVLGVLSLIFWSLIAGRHDQVRRLRAARRQPRRGRHPGADGAGPRQRRTRRRGAGVRDRARHVRRRAVLRRRHDHAGDLGAERGRGAGGRGAGASSRYVVPITRRRSWSACSSCSARGTGRVGALFGPVMLVWFVVAGGARRRRRSPATRRCCAALNPRYAVGFFVDARLASASSLLGAVFLAVTGAEALYADMGHFGRRPIRLAWFGARAAGAGAQLFRPGRAAAARPGARSRTRSTCWRPTGRSIRWSCSRPLATIIASQAVISGAFSLTRQAMQLGYLPRLEIRHTSAARDRPDLRAAGQLGADGRRRRGWCSASAVVERARRRLRHRRHRHDGHHDVARVRGRRRGAGTGAWRAGLAALGAVLRHRSRLPRRQPAARSPRAAGSRWSSACVLMLMTTWRRGRGPCIRRSPPAACRCDRVPRRHQTPSIRPRARHRRLHDRQSATIVPRALLHNLKHNKVLHERVVIADGDDRGRAARAARRARRGRGRSARLPSRRDLRYGFMESPNVPRALALCAAEGLHFDMM